VTRVLSGAVLLVLAVAVVWFAPPVLFFGVAELLRQVTQGVYVSDAELWERWRDTNERVSVRYVAFPPDRLVPDSAVSLTEAATIPAR